MLNWYYPQGMFPLADDKFSAHPDRNTKFPGRPNGHKWVVSSGICW